MQGLADVAEQIEAAGQRNAEIASLRHQKSMEVNALQLEKEEALASLAQQKQAELEAVTKIKDEELQLYKTRNQHLQEQLHAGVKRQETEEDGIRADQVERLLAEREVGCAILTA